MAEESCEIIPDTIGPAMPGHLTVVEPDERAVAVAAPPSHFLKSLAG